MIERFAMYELGNLRDRFGLTDGVPAGVRMNYNVSPTQLSPVIVSRDSKRLIERKMWGFLPSTAKDTRSVFRYKTTTAKSENIFDKAIWVDAIRTQRCIVPINGYYEWRKTIDGKRPFYLHAKDQALIGLAGIYSSWTNPEGEELGTFAIITAADDTHTGRSPIIISPNNDSAWLDPNISDVNSIYGMLKPLSNDLLIFHKVSSDIKNIKLNNAKSLNSLD